MKIRSAQAAILVKSRKPLIVDEITFPDELDVGQVLVKVLHTTICGAQINEIDAVKGEASKSKLGRVAMEHAAFYETSGVHILYYPYYSPNLSRASLTCQLSFKEQDRVAARTA